ncbi:MAG: outer membrane protein insertion porin family [Marivirga sp.]
MLHKLYKVTFLFLAIAFSSCVGTKYLEGDEKVLFKQKIKGNQFITDESLDNFYAQEANKRLLLLPISPYVAFFEVGQRYYSKEKAEQELENVKSAYQEKIQKANELEKKGKAQRLDRKRFKKTERLNKKISEGNLLMRWGEPLAVYDSAEAEYSRSQMKLFLESKGYFNAEVAFRTITKGLRKERVLVTYQIKERNAYYIDSIFYNTGFDTTMLVLLKVFRQASKVKEGDKYDQAALRAERERIEILMKNRGYFAFNRQFVEFNVFQSPDTNLLSLEVIINRPANQDKHKQFIIDKVNFTTDVNIQDDNGKRTEDIFNKIHYYYYKPQYKKKIIDQRVFIRPGQLYSLNKTFDTQRQLGNLDMFRFVNVKYDTAGGDFIANIFTSPLDKYQISNEVGVNVNVSYGLPGPFYNLSLKNRNPFGGVEILELSGRLGLDGVANFTDETDIRRSTDARVNLTLIFPHFLFPLGNTLKARFALLNPKTITGVGYNYTDRPGSYIRTNVNGSFGYSWRDQKKWIYDFTLADLNVIQSKLDSAFSDQLDILDDNSRGVQLKNSFLPSFVSSTYLSVAKNFNNYGNEKERASFIKFFLEAGGNMLHFNNFAAFSERSDLIFYQFVKSNIDFRHYFPYGRSSTLAFRVNVGAARSYGGFSGGALPYEKFFFAGGSSSIRAWAPRRLGPGSYVDKDENGEARYDFEKPGEVLFESSIELRRNLFSFIDGAFFIDIGNVWSISDSRPGAEFKLDSFYRQIAIGTGVGMRIDFSFLILRLDLGFKAYDPGQERGERWTINRWNLIGGNNYSPTFNLGIGYPF